MIATFGKRVLLAWVAEARAIKASEDPFTDYIIGETEEGPIRDPIYYELRSVESSKLAPGITPGIGKMFAECLDELIVHYRLPRTRTDILGVPYGADMFAEALSSRHGSNPIRLIKDINSGRITGFRNTEPPPPGTRFIIVENVSVDGKQIFATIQFLHNMKRGYEIAGIFSCIDRECGAREALGKLGYKLRSVISHGFALDFLEETHFHKEACERSRKNAELLRSLWRTRPLL